MRKKRTFLDGLEDFLHFLVLVCEGEGKGNERAARLVVAVYDVDHGDFGLLLKLGLERIDHFDVALGLLVLLVLLALGHAICLCALFLLFLLLLLVLLQPLFLDIFRHFESVQ